MEWPNRKKRLALEVECAEVSAKYPTLTLAFRPAGHPVGDAWVAARAVAVLEGLVPVPGVAGVGYRAAIVLARDHPTDAPIVVVTDPGIPRVPARHMSTQGIACLCARSDLRRFWPRGSRLLRFVDDLVVPYFAGQFCFQVTGSWPWPDRPHGIEGVLACYREMIGIDEPRLLRALLANRARGSFPRPQRPCLCKSGKQTRDCHMNEIKTIWDRVDADAARDDLADVIKHLKLKESAPVAPTTNDGTHEPHRVAAPTFPEAS